MRLAEPALRWTEPEAFSTSLARYSFEFGIRHLLAAGEHAQATKLIKSESYRKLSAQSLRNVQPLVDDISHVGKTIALEGKFDVELSTQLMVLALSERGKLISHLRETLDASASKSDWETVISLASAEPAETMRVLLALRAIVKAEAKIKNQAAKELKTVVTRWASETGKSEWQECVQWMLAPSAKLGSS